ncbi:hypothetical protein [Streptomyces botrytidirepellens]|uniref:hypothetical protein n=1 Tax=Streptomyces botrytidirepellens TaxID=2486417 RepID=UPI0011CDA711|nr:hypothetical protein [Streptomyces botrytidirepellens]
MAVPIRTRRPDAAVAAILRTIGQRPRPASFSLLCQPCQVSWAGPEADCWNCGRPASSKHPYGSALNRLLTAVEANGPTPTPRRTEV